MSTDNNAINQLNKHELKWFAVATKYKCEKYVVEALESKGIVAYVPLIETVKKYTSKVKRYKVPLLHCYAFVCINSDQYISVLETDYVLKFIKQRKDLLAIPEREIDLLKQIVGEYDESLQVVDKNFSLGEEVEVISGRLTGMTGRVISNSMNKAILVELKSIGIQLSINVKPEYLRSIVTV